MGPTREGLGRELLSSGPVSSRGTAAGPGILGPESGSTIVGSSSESSGGGPSLCTSTAETRLSVLLLGTGQSKLLLTTLPQTGSDGHPHGSPFTENNHPRAAPPVSPTAESVGPGGRAGKMSPHEHPLPRSVPLDDWRLRSGGAADLLARCRLHR
eukprot:63788-Pyramimonas_sp.AAC.1